MEGSLYLKTAPIAEPITTAEAKLHLKVDITDDDTLIAGLVTAARRWIEDLTGIRMMTQTWNYYLDEFPEESVIKLPIGPVASITSVKSTDSAGSVSTFSSGSYLKDLVSLPARIVLKDSASWPSNNLQEANGVDIEFVAGYGSATVVADLVAAQAAHTAAVAQVAAASTAGEITAAKAALSAAEAALTAAQAAQVTAVPEDLKLAIKLLVAHWYENRAAVTTQTLEQAPLALRHIINNYRMWQR